MACPCFTCWDTICIKAGCQPGERREQIQTRIRIFWAFARLKAGSYSSCHGRRLCPKERFWVRR